ncbi:hypothetical protein BKA60DRAFT_310117 [Fusarium oxysporum]|nr:hypothetical protein BKA60DRAFT_310117 [Fusarium oxysporum]
MGYIAIYYFIAILLATLSILAFSSLAAVNSLIVCSTCEKSLFRMLAILTRRFLDRTLILKTRKRKPRCDANPPPCRCTNFAHASVRHYVYLVH